MSNYIQNIQPTSSYVATAADGQQISLQAQGSLGRQVQEGNQLVTIDPNFGGEKVEVKMRVETMSGLSSHSGRNDLLQFISRMQPKPKKIIIPKNQKTSSKVLRNQRFLAPTPWESQKRVK